MRDSRVTTVAAEQTTGTEGGGITRPLRGQWLAFGLCLILINTATLLVVAHRLRSMDHTIAWVLAPQVALRAYGEGAAATLKPRARNRVDVYSDLTCELCRLLAPALLAARDSLMKADVAWTYHPITPSPIKDPVAFYSGIVSICAIEQGAEWELLRASARHNLWSRSALAAAIEQAGLDRAAVERCAKSDEARSLLWQSLFSAASAGVEGTPVVAVNGARLEGFHDERSLLNFIRAETGVHDPQ